MNTIVTTDLKAARGIVHAVLLSLPVWAFVIALLTALL